MPYDVRDVPQFEKIRQRQANRMVGQQAQAGDAMKRAYARMGALNSGAYAKQVANQQDEFTRQNEDAQQGIDFAEAQERSRQDERGQDVGFRKEQFDFQKAEAAENRKMQQHQFDKNYELQEAQIGMDRDAQEFNKKMASKKQPGLVGSILGGGGIGGMVGEVFGGGGKFFCTELYVRGLASSREMLKMCEFFFRCMWSDTSTCYFYAMNGHKIVAAANKAGFDWAGVKEGLIDEVINNMEKDKIQISKLLYKYQIMTLCLRFDETKDLYDPKSLETSMLDRITKLPRLMTTKTFWRACKIWLSYRIAHSKGMMYGSQN